MELTPEQIAAAKQRWVAALAEEVRRLVETEGMPEEDAMEVVIRLGQKAITAKRG